MSSNTLQKLYKAEHLANVSFVKKKLSEALIEVISPIGKKIIQLMEDKVYLEGILKKGKEKASIKSEENLKKIREIIGLL